MNRLERELKESLKRREPPPGLAERVLAHTFATEKPGFSGWRWLAVAAMVVLMVGGVALVREHRRQAEGERTKQQLMVALRITGSKLRSVQEKLSVIQQRAIELQLQQ
jgi:anti-sigma-K factor RskA